MMPRVKSALKRIFRVTGFDVVRLPSSFPPPSPAKNYFYENDDLFERIYRDAITITNSPHDPDVFPHRLYNTLQFLKYTMNEAGDVADCGSFKGRSSYLFCQYLRLANPGFNGEGYHIFDSFQGLSQPTKEDTIDDSDYGPEGKSFMSAGSFSGGLDEVKSALKDFPLIDYHSGWIPESFPGVPERDYKFVHLDLDLFEPIYGAIEYFYPRLVHGGVIVIDEYGLPRWPGAAKAVDTFCASAGIIPIGLTTGNGVIIKRG
jgi:hypothetical protein